jgi:hypothetical protein
VGSIFVSHGRDPLRRRFLRRLTARREELGPDRLALPAPEGEVVGIDVRGSVDTPQAAVERAERGQQQGEVRGGPDIAFDDPLLVKLGDAIAFQSPYSGMSSEAVR